MKKLLSLILCVGLATGSFSQADDTQEKLKQLEEKSRKVNIWVNALGSLGCAYVSWKSFKLGGKAVLISGIFGTFAATESIGLGVAFGLGTLGVTAVPLFALSAATGYGAYKLGKDAYETYKEKK